MYRLLYKLGNGGMGVVYAAEKQPHDLPVAVKLLRSDLPGCLADRTVDMFHMEARTSWEVNHGHLNLVTVYDYGTAESGQHYIIMERVDGVNLGDLHRPSTPDYAMLRRIACDILVALDHLHRNGLIHRDITPRNILVSNEGIAKLTDLGLVKEQQGTLSGNFWGNPPYASMEALEGKEQTPTSDLYSFGVVLYERVTGSKPYDGRLPHELLDAMRAGPPAPLPDDVPADLAALITALMIRDPAKRVIQMADDALEYLDGPLASDTELARLVALSPQPEPDPTVPRLGWPFSAREPEPAPRARRGWFMALVLASSLSLGTLGLGFGLGRTSSPAVPAAETVDTVPIPPSAPLGEHPQTNLDQDRAISAPATPAAPATGDLDTGASLNDPIRKNHPARRHDRFYDDLPTKLPRPPQ